MFSKFVTSSKLERYVDQVCDWAPRKINVFTQTDNIPRSMLASVEEELYPIGKTFFLIIVQIISAV